MAYILDSCFTATIIFFFFVLRFCLGISSLADVLDCWMIKQGWGGEPVGTFNESIPKVRYCPDEEACTTATCKDSGTMNFNLISAVRGTAISEIGTRI